MDFSTIDRALLSLSRRHPPLPSPVLSLSSSLIDLIASKGDTYASDPAYIEGIHWTMDVHVPWPLLAVLSVVLVAASAVTAVLSGRQAMGAAERGFLAHPSRARRGLVRDRGDGAGEIRAAGAGRHHSGSCVASRSGERDEREGVQPAGCGRSDDHHPVTIDHRPTTRPATSVGSMAPVPAPDHAARGRVDRTPFTSTRLNETDRKIEVFQGSCTTDC